MNMLSVRELRLSDHDQVKEIYEREKYPFGLFSMDKFLCGFCVTDENEKIISAGGLRELAEVVLITDRTYGAKVRREALSHMLQASIYVADKFKLEQIHAFVQDDEKWIKRLRESGFTDITGTGLVYTL